MYPSEASRSLFHKRAFAGIVMAILVSVAGCATTSPAEEAYDPYEGFNRSIFNFNDALDRSVIKPVADAYVEVTPESIRSAVSKLFDNLGYINVILNSFLQGKGLQGLSDTGRFVVNSTLGIGGLFDPATEMGLIRHEEDFGQTLGVWGAGEGAYLVLPVFGPSTFRDAPGLAVSAATNPLNYIGANPPEAVITLPAGAAGGIDQRARAKGAFELIDQAALDRYVFIREAYRQRRLFLIYDGNPPQRLLKEEQEGGKAAPAKR